MTKGNVFCKLILLCSFLLIAETGCRKNNDTTVQPSFLVADKQNVTSYEIATMTVKNIALGTDKFEGTFNGTPITIGGGDSTLSFMIPDVGPGTYDMNLKIDGKDYEIKYTVTASQAIADPEQYIHNALDAMMLSDAEIDQMKTEIMRYPGADSSGSTIAQIEAIKKIYAEMEEKFATATKEEKAVAAKFIAANPQLFSKVTFNPNPTANDSTGLELFKTNATIHNAEQIAKELDKFIITSCKTIWGACAVNILVLEVAPAQFKLVAALTAGATAGLIYTVNTKLIQATAQAIFRFDGLTMSEIQRKTTSPDVFVNGVPYKMTIKSHYQNLNKNCSVENAPIISSISNSLNQFGEAWNKYFGKISSWFNIGKPFHYMNVNKAADKQLIVNAQYLSIKNISNDKVTATVENNNGTLLVKFSTNESLAQDFTYDLVYNCEGFAPYAQAMSGRISNEVDFCSGFSNISQLGLDFILQSYDYISVSDLICTDKYLYRIDESGKAIVKYDNRGKLLATLTTISTSKGYYGEIAYYSGYIWAEANNVGEQILMKIDPETGVAVSSKAMSADEIGFDGASSMNTYIFATETGLYTLVDKYFSTGGGSSLKMYKIDTATGSRIFVKSTPRIFVGYIAYNKGYLYIESNGEVLRWRVDGTSNTKTSVVDYWDEYGANKISISLLPVCGKLYSLVAETNGTGPRGPIKTYELD